MNNYIPPSTPQRSWGLIAFFFLTTSLAIFSFLVYFFWPSGFGKITEHIDFLLLAAKELIHSQTAIALEQYVRALESIGILVNLSAFVIMQMLSSLIISTLIVWKVCLSKPAKPRDVRIKGGTVKNAPNKPVHASSEELQLHPRVQLNTQQQSGNIFTFGAHGSGKSTLIKYLVSQLIKSQRNKVVLFDEKREYEPLFFAKESAYLIAPWDGRGCIWDISTDFTSTLHFKLFASQIIPVDESKPIWGQGAQEILVALMVCCSKSGKLTWSSLSEWINKPYTDWQKPFREHFPSATNLVCAAEETVSSFVSNLSAHVSWIHDIAKLEEEGAESISLKKWILRKNQKRRTLIIQSHPLYAAMMKSMTSTMLHYLTALVLATKDNEEERTWLILDELGNLPKLGSLDRWLSMGRSKGARTIAGTQNISQTREIYGDNISETILNLFKSHVVFQCGSLGKTAETASESLGEVVFERPTLNNSQQDQPTYSWHKFTEKLVQPVDIVNLSNTSDSVVGFAKLGGDKDVYKLQWKFFDNEPATNNEPYQHLSPEQVSSNRLVAKRAT